MREDNKRKLSEQLIKCLLDDKLSNDKKLRKMDYIIRLGADVNARYENGFSVLVLAKTIRNDEVVSFLEERGASCIGCDKEKVEEFFRTASVDEINKVLKVLPDGYDLDCDVDLSGRGLTELPDFSRLVVWGRFDCSYNHLETLKGAPSEVRGSFHCKDNRLTSLEGAPSKVSGGFYCSHNEFKTLKGTIREIGGDFQAGGLYVETLSEELQAKVCGRILVRKKRKLIGKELEEYLKRKRDFEMNEI